MIVRVVTVAFQSIEAIPVDIQIKASHGLNTISIVGLADKIAAESCTRIQAALFACGLSLPLKKITVTLSPIDLPKAGSHYDLPIAIGLLIAMSLLPSAISDHYLILGKLSLNGHVEPVEGVLPAALTALNLKRGIICPASTGSEAAWLGTNLDILAPSGLLPLVNHFNGKQILSRPIAGTYQKGKFLGDFNEIQGQNTVKRALKVAAAGRHNLLLVEHTKAKKFMLAERFPSILPPLSARELLDVSLIHSLAGAISQTGISPQRPFRAPNHSISMAAMIGGGNMARPGEVSLAHNGVLFLDDLSKFSPKVLNSLRQPLETGEITITHAKHHIRYPARIQLISTINSCHCSLADESKPTCNCRSHYQIGQTRLSDAFLDKIDMCIHVPALDTRDLQKTSLGASSDEILQMVIKAREIQYQRFHSMGLNYILTNSDCPATYIKDMIDQNTKGILEQACKKINLSKQTYHTILQVSLTIADLDQNPVITSRHLAEAFSYRLNLEKYRSLNLKR